MTKESYTQAEFDEREKDKARLKREMKPKLYRQLVRRMRRNLLGRFGKRGDVALVKDQSGIERPIFRE